MASTTVARAVAAICLAVCLQGCSSCGPEPTMADADLSDSSAPDAGDASTPDATTPDDADDGSTVVRSLVDVPPHGGLPTANRIASPEFQPVHRNQVRSDSGTGLRRQVYRETPYEAATVRMLGEGRPMDLLLWGQAGGEHTASVWIGADDEAPVATVELVGIGLGDLSGPTQPIAMNASDETVSANGRVWVRYAAEFVAVDSPFVMRISGDGSTDLLVHAPVVLDEP